MKGLLFAFLLVTNIAFAQQVDYNFIIPPKGTTNSVSEKLVRIAWDNYPQNEVLKREITIAEKEVTQAKMEWLNMLFIAGNMNEFTIDPPTDRAYNFYPRYNFGANIPLGAFGTIPAEVKKTKERVKISEANLNTQKFQIRALVLETYENYLMNKELLAVQIQSTEDAYSIYAIAEQQFKNGEITIEEFNAGAERYNMERINKITAENRVKVSQIKLEGLIGVPLESVL